MLKFADQSMTGQFVRRKFKHSGFVILVFALCLFSQRLSARKVNLDLKWTTNQKCFIESSATVADINNDGLDEAIITSQEEVIAVGKDGQDLWRWRSKGRFMTYPAVLKRTGKTALIYAADNHGQLTCLDGTGIVVWQANLNGGSEWSASVIADLYGDGAFEVIQTDISGTIWIFEALTGKVIKKTAISGQPVSPSVGDLNGDGKSEIVIATTDGYLTALSNDLSELWRIKIGVASESWSTSAPVMYSASDGKTAVVAASANGEIFCLNGQGKAIWQYPTNVPVSSSISVGDIDQDGQADIFLVTHTGLIYRFDETGNVVWKIDMQGRSLAPGAIGDINNDGKPEYILSTQQGNLLVLNNQGEVIFNRQLPSRTINVTPSFGHLFGNSDKLEMILTGGEAGLAYCFETPVTKNPKMQWSDYRCNIQNTGSWFGLTKSDELRMVPQNLSWNKLFTGEKILFNICNPKPGANPLKAKVVCISPDGARNYAVANIYGNEGQLLLPVDYTLPGSYRFNWSLSNSDDKELLASTREVTLQPFENDRALTTLSINTLNNAADQTEPVLPLSALALRKEAADIQLRANSLNLQQHQVRISEATALQATLKQTAGLNEQAKRAISVSEIVTKAATLGAGTSLIAFEGNKWDNRNVDNQLPASVGNPVLLNHTVVPGEHHPVPVVLFNVTDHLLNARIVIDNPDKEIRINPLHAINTASSLGEESWDALPEMDESGVIAIPSLSSREVWLDVKIGEVKPGKKTFGVTIQALNGAGVLDSPASPHAVPAPETKVKIVLDVLPFKMAPSADFHLCTWSPSTGPDIPSLLDHGNNVFQLVNPAFTYNSNNELTGFDFTETDKVLDGLKGKEPFFLVTGLPGIKEEFAGEGYKKQFGRYLKELVSHLAGYGVNTNQFALYPIDEPGGSGWKAVNQLVQLGLISKGINPEVMIYTDGGGELPMFQAMAKCLDIWSPTIDWVADKTPEMNVMRTKGKLLWSYNCSYASSRPVGPNIKNINLIYEFRTAALLALRNGVSGIGFWCYNLSGENPWSRIKLEYNLVYPGISKSITSRRWEAVREGIEDYRIIDALKKHLREPNADAEICKNIAHLINVSLPALVDPGYRAMKLGQSREVFDRVCSESKMDGFRDEMMACVKMVSAGAKKETSADKLGFPAGKKVLLLHCDDIGMCPEANTAAIHYLEGGFLHSAAVMMPCPNAAAMIAWAKNHPSEDIGLHLTLTSEWNHYRWGAVSDPAKVPGLIDPEGKLWHEVPEVVTHASDKEVETEIRAQIDKSIALGYRPTHIDTHMGTLYESVGYVKVFLKVAEEYHIPANIINVSNPEIAENFRKASGYPLTDDVIRAIGEYKLPKLDNFTSVPEGSTYAAKRANFFKMVKSLESGLTEIIFHPSVPSENMKTITGTWQQRAWEAELFADPLVIQFFKDEGIILTNWKEIMNRFENKN